jgi:large subunit ribosomal protein L10
MLRERKEQVVAELSERLRTATTLLVADYRGLTHAELDAVRSELLQHGARLSVVKNTLTRRAADAAGVDALDEFLTGPTAIAFVTDGDPVAVAKTLSETARETRRLTLKGGLLEGRAIDARAVSDLAALPPADVLRGQVLGVIVAPLTGLLGLVSAPLQDLAGLVDARIDQLGEPGEAALVEVEPPSGTASGEPEEEAASEAEPEATEIQVPEAHAEEAQVEETTAEE